MSPDRLRDFRETLTRHLTGAEMPLADHGAAPVLDDRRDSVRALASDADDGGPTVVSISDIHGYLDEATSALLTLSDHPDYDPVVTTDEEGRLHWAGNDYVLVVNGDLVDRGPDSVETLRTVARLRDEAPAGRVRVTLGNHEMGILTPDLFDWPRWYCTTVDEEGRRALLEEIRRGHVVAAYEGYRATYVHAGQSTPFEVERVNDDLVAAAERLLEALGTDRDADVQESVVDDYPTVLGVGSGHPKGPDAGLVWIHFDNLPADAPPQVVGHSRQEDIIVKGNVVCQNVIQSNADAPGGEAVVVETPDSLVALRRDADGGVTERALDPG